MPSARHRKDRPADAWKQSGRLTRMAVLATTVTATVVTVGVASGASSRDVELPTAAAASVTSVDLTTMVESREQRVSRTADRIRLEPRPVAQRFATREVTLRAQPSADATAVGVVEWSTRVPVTGQVQDGWSEVLVGDEVRWLRTKYLSDTKPEPETAAAVGGLSSAPCPDGSSIESGLTSAADRVYRAVCAAFPQPSVYGGLDPHGEHVDGRAIDIMISGEVGWQIAEWLRVNASALQIRDIIYSQKIWTPDRAGEGWRSMSDRGSVTANHYDHVHVAVY
jgi:hypothetical protein